MIPSANQQERGDNLKERKNLDLRAWIVGHGLTYGEVAKQIPISNAGFSTMLQRELDKSEKKEIIIAAKRALLIKERGLENEEGVYPCGNEALLPHKCD